MTSPGSTAAGGMAGKAGAAIPTGPGWIIKLVGYHYHNNDPRNQGAQFVRQTLCSNLRSGAVKLPTGEAGAIEDVPLQELGIACPILVGAPHRLESVELIDPASAAEATLPPTVTQSPGGSACRNSTSSSSFAGSRRPWRNAAT